VTEDDRSPSVLGPLIDFSTLKFKQRDELEDVISSWCTVHQYEIGKHWDQRLRAHYKERYDTRLNMVDWDYMYTKNMMPHVNQRQYKQWRHCGLAFEWRLTDNKVPNRTFSSYLPAY
jgi:dynein assembly factor 3, axonemal